MSILTRDVDDIIFADVTDGDMDLFNAYDALFAYSSGQTEGTFEEFIETGNNIGTSIVTALTLGDFESVRFADEAVRQLANQGVLETRDVDNIILADLTNGDMDLSTAYNALFAFSFGQTQDTGFQQNINAANNIGDHVVTALESGDFESVRFADEAVRQLSNQGLLESSDVDDIILADLTNGDIDLSTAYNALFAFSNGFTQDTSFQENIGAANAIGNHVVTALNLGDFESVRFADEAVRQLSNQGLLQTRDVDNIIIADLTNGDMDLSTAYNALFSFSNGSTQDTNFNQTISAANNIGNHVVTALNLGDFESVRFADEAVRQLSNQGLLQTRDVDNIIIADLRNGDMDLSTAYNALFAFSNGFTQDSSFNQTIYAANNIGNHIVTALNLGDFESLRFADVAVGELANQGLLQTRDVDNIILADVRNGDTDLASAYMAMDAFTQGFTQDTGFNQTIAAANNIGRAIVDALRNGDFDSVRFAEFATQQLAQQGLLETRDVDDIVYRDIVNGDNDLSTAYTAIDAFTNGFTQDTGFDQTLIAANRIGNFVVTALRQGDFDSVRFAEYATQQLANQGLLETRDVDDIIYRDVINGDDDLSTAYTALDAFVSGFTQDTGFDQTIAAANNIGRSIVESLRQGDFDDVRFAEYATQQLGQQGLLETLDIDDIVFRDVVNGDDDLASAYAAVDAFVSGGSQGATFEESQDVAESIVNSAETAQNTLGFTGEQFADYVANVLDGYTDTSGLV